MMAGYTQHWDCRICKEPQDTDGTPKHHVCIDCLENLAETLCCNKLNHSIHHPGIDKNYWVLEADKLVNVLFKRWKGVR